MNARPSLDVFVSGCREALVPLLPSGCQIGTITVIEPKHEIADSAAKLFFYSTLGEPLAVAICSQTPEPTLVDRNAEFVESAHKLLPPQIAASILEPLTTGTIEGMPFLMLPFCRVLSSSRWRWFIQKTKLRGKLLIWLNQVLETSQHVPPANNCQSRVSDPLTFITGCEDLTDDTRQLAENALDRLNTNKWTPQLSLTHTDLWKGNVLLPEPNNPLLAESQNDSPFHLIDWGGGTFEGHSSYDLIRIGRSFGVPHSTMLRALYTQSEIMECELEDCLGGLLSGLGLLGMNRGHFPYNRFLNLVEDCRSFATDILRPTG